MRVHRWLSLALLVVTGCGGARHPAPAPAPANACGGGRYAVRHAGARLVAGGADVVDPPRLSEASVRALPRSTPRALLVVPGAAHGDLLTSPPVLRRVAAHFAAYLRA